MSNKFKLIIGLIFLSIVLIGIATYFFINSYESENIGSNNLGYITKDTYSYYANPTFKIAIVSGMHPRENLSAEVLPKIAQSYALWNNLEVVNYKVTVLDNPDNFYTGRSNGESLVHDFIVKDINQSDFDLVIVGHDHEEGYGEGFYIVTPSMDSKSIALGEKVIKDLPNFKHYKRETNKVAKSTSISTVDNPIVATGTPLFVYEIPEWLGFDEAYKESYSLVETSFKNILV